MSPHVGRAIISLSLFALESDEELEVPELTFMQSGNFLRSQLYKSCMARRVAAQIASLLANAGATDADRATRATSLLSCLARVSEHLTAAEAADFKSLLSFGATFFDVARLSASEQKAFVLRGNQVPRDSLIDELSCERLNAFYCVPFALLQFKSF